MTTPDRLWNPRYLHYARVHGRSPEAQLAHDKLRYPSACMIDFVAWNRARIHEYARIHPGAVVFGGLVDHEGYDAYLAALPHDHGATGGLTL